MAQSGERTVEAVLRIVPAWVSAMTGRSIRTCAHSLFLLSNLVAKLNSVMRHVLARSKLPSVDSIDGSFRKNGRPRFGY